MKLRTQQQVLDALDKEIAWRKKEIANVCVAIRDSRQTFVGNLTRSAFPLIYSHWEGGVKRCASYYLEYVARQKLRYDQLKSNFVTISCASSIQQAAASGQLHVYAQVVDFLLFNQGDRYQKPSSFEIQTDSNLSSKVMDNICFNVGISLGVTFEINRKFIDSNLLKTRNAIAHGSPESVESEFLFETRDRVLDLLGLFKIELQNAVVSKSYLRA